MLAPMTGSPIPARSLIAYLALAAAVATTTSGCTMSCSAVGVAPGFHIAVDAGDGVYTVIVNADGEELALEVTLADGRATCPGEGCFAFGSELEITVTGSSSDVDGFRLRVARMNALLGPDQVDLEVFRGAEQVYADTLVADYEPSYPNGESCGSAGDIAKAEVVLR
jgi:hypothetical protein